MEPEPVVRPSEGAELCAQACAVMNKHLVGADGLVGCDEGKPVPVPLGEGDIDCATEEAGGAQDCLSCDLFCQQMHASGSFWNTSCIVFDIATCAEIETYCNTQ